VNDVFTGKRTWLPGSTIRPRKITAKERAWLIRGLHSLSTGEYVGCHAVDLDTGTHPLPGKPVDPRPYLAQLDTLVVIKKCGCGQKTCHTVTFRQSKSCPPSNLVFSKTDDGRLLIIDVNRETGELSGLEII
jgi:hypothetical protein